MKFVLAAFVTFFAAFAAAGSNEPIADNELGLTAKDCAAQFCSSKDGLELWLTLEQTCMMDPNPYFVARVEESTAATVTWYGRGPLRLLPSLLYPRAARTHAS